MDPFFRLKLSVCLLLTGGFCASIAPARLLADATGDGQASGKASVPAVDIGVAYKEDADRVIDLIKQIRQELREDPAFRPLILDDLTMLGVDAFGDSAVMIKFFIKTRPLKQWDVKREMLRRMKRCFDEQGIEIPFPHRTIYHRHEADQTQLESNAHWAERKSA